MNRMELTDLPLKYQRQVLAKLQGRQKPKKSKMHNLPDTRQRNGKTLKFDSKKEARRFDELMLMLNAGEISDLRLQEDFTITEAFTTPEGERIRATRYRADFTYWKEGKKIVEDSKGHRTKDYIIKRKCVADKYGVIVLET